MSREIVMVNLDVLSQLQLGSRLRCRHGRFFELYPQSQGFRFVVPTMFLRWWESSSRHSDFQAIADVYATATNMLAQLSQLHTNHARAVETALVRRLRLSLRGLDVFTRTYADDVTLVSRLQRLRERVELLCQPYPADDAADVPVTPPPFAFNADAPTFLAAAKSDHANPTRPARPARPADPAGGNSA